MFKHAHCNFVHTNDKVSSVSLVVSFCRLIMFFNSLIPKDQRHSRVYCAKQDMNQIPQMVSFFRFVWLIQHNRGLCRSVWLIYCSALHFHSRIVCMHCFNFRWELLFSSVTTFHTPPELHSIVEKEKYGPTTQQLLQTDFSSQSYTAKVQLPYQCGHGQLPRKIEIERLELGVMNHCE